MKKQKTPLQDCTRMSLRQVVKQSDGFYMEILDGEAFLYHLSDTRILYCNQTALLVWQLCDGKRSGEEIVAILQKSFPETVDGIAEDVEDVLQQFVTFKALEEIPAGSLSCPGS